MNGTHAQQPRRRTWRHFSTIDWRNCTIWSIRTTRTPWVPRPLAAMSSVSNLRLGDSEGRGLQDGRRGQFLTLGVVAWDVDARGYQIPMMAPRERLSGVSTNLRIFAQFAQLDMAEWAA